MISGLGNHGPHAEPHVWRICGLSKYLDLLSTSVPRTRSSTPPARGSGRGQTLATYPAAGTAVSRNWKFQGRLDISSQSLNPLYEAGARLYSPGIGAFTFGLGPGPGPEPDHDEPLPVRRGERGHERRPIGRQLLRPGLRLRPGQPDLARQDDRGDGADDERRGLDDGQ